MAMWLVCVILCIHGFIGYSTAIDNLQVAQRHWMREPTVMVAVLVRNKAHTLPWFLYYLQNLDYPKQRIRLWYICFVSVPNFHDRRPRKWYLKPVPEQWH